MLADQNAQVSGHVPVQLKHDRPNLLKVIAHVGLHRKAGNDLNLIPRLRQRFFHIDFLDEANFTFLEETRTALYTFFELFLALFVRLQRLTSRDSELDRLGFASLHEFVRLELDRFHLAHGLLQDRLDIRVNYLLLQRRVLPRHPLEIVKSCLIFLISIDDTL